MQLDATKLLVVEKLLKGAKYPIPHSIRFSGAMKSKAMLVYTTKNTPQRFSPIKRLRMLKNLFWPLRRNIIDLLCLMPYLFGRIMVIYYLFHSIISHNFNYHF